MNQNVRTRFKIRLVSLFFMLMCTAQVEQLSAMQSFRAAAVRALTTAQEIIRSHTFASKEIARHCVQNPAIQKIGAFLAQGSVPLSLLIAGGYLYQDLTSSSIQDFDYERDHLFIEKLFEENEQFLSIGRTLAEKWLKRHTSTVTHVEIKKIKVLFVKQTPIGFIYYTIAVLPTAKPIDAHIGYLAITEEQRGKGFAKQLLSETFKDLKNHHAKTVSLAVAHNNEPARALYKRMGFKESTKKLFLIKTLTADKQSRAAKEDQLRRIFSS